MFAAHAAFFALPSTVTPASFDAVGTAVVGNGTASGLNFTASTNADVFVIATTDRSGGAARLTGATYGGSPMTLVARVDHSGNSSYGSTWVYYLAGAGTGSSKAVAISNSGNNGGWWMTNAVSFMNVGAISSTTATSPNNTSTSLSHTASMAGTMIMYVIGAGNGGTAGANVTVSGGTNRYNSGTAGNGVCSVINTATASTTFTANNVGGTGLGSIAICF